MPSARAIKNRIKSTKNIKQITKAMEAVSAVKMRKSQEYALQSRPHAFAAMEILKNLSGDNSLTELYESSLLEQREEQHICLAVVTSDKGLCGAFNGNVLRKVQEFIDDKREGGVEVDLVVVGKKAKDFAKKKKMNVTEEYLGIGDWAHPEQTRPIAKKLEGLFRDNEFDAVYAVYTNFVSVLKQEVLVEQLLPFSKEEIERRVEEIAPDSGKHSDVPKVFGNSAEGASYAFEPSPQEVLDELLPLLLEVSVHHIVLEANASEHSARMVAMKNASENASELIDDLTLSYNKARQAQITKELTEITGGAAALDEV